MNDTTRDKVVMELRLNVLGLSKDLERKVEADERDFRELWRAVKEINDKLNPIAKKFNADSSVGSWRSSQFTKRCAIITVAFAIISGVCGGAFALFQVLMAGG